MNVTIKKNKMPFFFPNKTKCKICSNVIKEHKHAVVLDYVNPDITPDLISYSRNFAHRNCFNNWEHHDR